MSNTTQEGFITLDEAKESLNITDANSDNILGKLITAQSAAVQSKTNRSLIKSTKTEYFSGDYDLKSLNLSEWPVSSITSVHDDTERAYAAVSLISSADYVFDQESGILKFETFLTRGQNNIKVVYVAGYDPLPEDLKLAVIYLVCAEYKALRIQVNTREGMQIAKSQIDDLRATAEKLLDPYRRYPSNG